MAGTYRFTRLWILGAFSALALLIPKNGLTETDIPTSGVEPGQKVEVDSLAQRYWEQGKGSKVEVIQNRLYLKAHRFELSGYGSLIQTDPFLSVTSVGVGLGYYLSEYWAIDALAWKSFATSSSLRESLQRDQGITLHTNPPKGFLGAAAEYLPIYGKLSLGGLSLFHFDLGVSLGTGVTFTDNGNCLTGLLGIIGHFHLSRVLVLGFRYWLNYYSESIQINTNPAASVVSWGRRENWTDVITLGLSVLF